MTKHHTDPPELRRQAEEKLSARWGVRNGNGVGEPDRLSHELEVHQIELEMQNEELRHARLENEVGLERYTSLFDFAPIGYATLSAGGEIRAINHAAANIVQRERRRLIGMRFGMLVHSTLVQAFNEMFERAMHSDETVSGDLVLDNHVEVAMRVRALPAAAGTGDAVVLLTFDDITARKADQDKLVRAEQSLREADRRKDEFLAALSHELRNPLAPIRNSLYVLSRAEAGGEQAKKALGVIDRQVGHLTRLVDDLLDVTRMAQGKVELRRERVELGDLVRRTMDDYRTSFETTGIRLVGNFEPGLFWVNGDAARLIQAISNLLGNAEKFTPRGGTVTVSLSRVDGQVAVHVRDTGAGIEPALIRHVFESFVQAPQTMERARGGLGLGLALVKAFVEMHGGTVSITSDGVGKGTEVELMLPTDQPPPRRSHTQELMGHGRKRRVLVIDDNADTSDTMKDGLELSGHEVVVAYDGPMGLDLARSFRPEIVVCDIRLPGMNGYSVAQALRAVETLRGIYLIAVSGYARPEDVQRATEAGFDRHVAKPIRLEKLARLIAEAPGGGVMTGPAPSPTALH